MESESIFAAAGKDTLVFSSNCHLPVCENALRLFYWNKDYKDLVLDGCGMCILKFLQADKGPSRKVRSKVIFGGSFTKALRRSDGTHHLTDVGLCSFVPVMRRTDEIHGF